MLCLLAFGMQQASWKRAVVQRQSLLLDACDNAFRTSLSTRPSLSSTGSDGPDSIANKRHSRRELLRTSAVFTNVRTRDGKVIISKTRRSSGQTPSRGSTRAAVCDPLSLLSGSPSCAGDDGVLIPEGRTRHSYVTDVVNLYAQVLLAPLRLLHKSELCRLVLVFCA